MKTAIILVVVIYFICLSDAYVSRTKCKMMHGFAQYEKNYPCEWRNQLLESLDTGLINSPVFRCRNVPINAKISYSFESDITKNQIEYSASLWAVDEPYVIDVTDDKLFSNYETWISSDKNSIIQCINYPNCLDIVGNSKQILDFSLGNNVGISQTTTYNLYIHNENINNIDINTLQYDVDYVKSNCLQIIGNVSIV